MGLLGTVGFLHLVETLKERRSASRITVPSSLGPHAPETERPASGAPAQHQGSSADKEGARGALLVCTRNPPA